jgi:hypothetical protein
MMPSFHRRRRFRFVGLTLAAFAALAVVFVAGSSANLAGSNFEGNDGNLVVTNSGNTDWVNAPNRVAGVDITPKQNDNSFGQGTKEDDPAVSVVTGSIPGNKDDFTRFYAASESAANNHNYVYLAWERTNTNGTANMDFEINQKTQPDMTTPGAKTLNRTAGDLLVRFDFSQGGGTVVLTLNKWLTAADGAVAGDCVSSNTLPCWGAKPADDALDGLDDNQIDLSLAGFAQGAVNGTTVTDPIANASLLQNEFGETAIDLTAAGVFPPGTCEGFGSAFLKSRASTAFGAEVKDFVAPQPVNISNCGRIIIRKVTVPNPDPTDTTFQYTTTGGLNPASFGLKNGQNQDYGNTVQQGSYSVTETDPSPNFKLTNIDCSASSTSGGSSATTDLANRKVSISLKPNDTIDCTYTNTLQEGAIKITKTSSKPAGSALQGAKFSITGPNSFSTSVTTGSDGTVCVDHLRFGAYSVTETDPPPGYAIDDTSAHTVTVNAVATCSSGTPATFAATDTPLTDVVVKATSQASGGTQSKITCVNSSSANIGNSPQGFADPVQVTANGLKPGTYTCTIEIDP